MQPNQKRMLDVGICCPEDATLLGGPNHARHIKNQSLKIAYDEAIVTEWSIGKMGHIALPIEMHSYHKKL